MNHKLQKGRRKIHVTEEIEPISCVRTQKIKLSDKTPNHMTGLNISSNWCMATKQNPEGITSPNVKNIHVFISIKTLKFKNVETTKSPKTYREYGRNNYT